MGRDTGGYGRGEVQATCWPPVTTRATWLHSCFSGILKDRRQGGPGLRIKCNSAPDLSLHRASSSCHFQNLAAGVAFIYIT